MYDYLSAYRAVKIWINAVIAVTMADGQSYLLIMYSNALVKTSNAFSELLKNRRNDY